MYEKNDDQQFEDIKSLFQDVKRPLDNLRKVENDIGQTVEADSDLIKFCGILSKQELIESQRNSFFQRDSLRELLSTTNYSADNLSDRNVIIFKAPIYVEILHLNPNNAKNRTSTVGLIQEPSTDFIHINPIKKSSDSMELNETYKIQKIISGLILPNNSSFVSLFAIDLNIQLSKRSLTDAYSEVVAAATNAFGKVRAMIYLAEDKINEKEIKHKSLTDEIKELNDSLKRSNLDVEDSLKNFTSAKNNLEEVNKQIADSQSKLEQNISEINNKNNLINELNEEFKHISEKIKSFKSEILSLKQETKTLQDEKQQLKKDINVTTLDMKGFSLESGKQLKRFYWSTLLSLLLLTSVFFTIYNNATEYKSLLEMTDEKGLLAILLSRLPLVTATALVIGTLSALIFYLFKHIIEINTEKMNMLKAAILAEQVAHTIKTENMSDDEVLELKRKAKIELLMQVFPNCSRSTPNEINSALIAIKEVMPSIQEIKKQFPLK